MDKPIHIGDEPVHLEAHVSAPQFTCLSCLIGFPDGDAQRAHYRSDHHRYNMKRRVAGLPPISTLAFNQKVLDKRAETALTTADRGATCEVCNKVYSTENAYRSHIISKKHRENELKIALQPTTSAPVSGEVPSAPEAYGGGSSTIAESSTTPANATSTPSANKDEDDSDEDMEQDEEENEQTLDEKLAAARSRIGPTSCLFCPVSSPTAPENIEHMAKVHSFFIPDAAYVEDLPGLITYLAEKLAIGNACLHCNREFRDLHAVRKHMFDKSHLKIAYDTERQRLEISDFYDFTSSYPDADAAGNARRNRTARKTITAASANADEEWESDEDEENVTVGDDESVYDVESESDESDDELAANNLEYGDTPYELVLPSGARIGHRSMSRYYKQSFSSPLPQKHAVKEGAAPSGRELVHRILAEKDGVLVPAHGGGFGAFGKGTQVIKARNRGEAKEAGRHVREFRDQNRREQFKTKVGFIANSQKHFRDPLLQ